MVFTSNTLTKTLRNFVFLSAVCASAALPAMANEHLDDASRLSGGVRCLDTGDYTDEVLDSGTVQFSPPPSPFAQSPTAWVPPTYTVNYSFLRAFCPTSPPQGTASYTPRGFVYEPPSYGLHNIKTGLNT